jgi:hypothetical protein
MLAYTQRIAIIEPASRSTFKVRTARLAAERPVPSLNPDCEPAYYSSHGECANDIEHDRF